MSNNDKLNNLLRLCDDLQVLANTREVTTDIGSLMFTCDLLLRNMGAILELQAQGKPIESEFGYISDNILASYFHLTNDPAINAANKYNIPY